MCDGIRDERPATAQKIETEWLAMPSLVWRLLLLEVGWVESRRGKGGMEKNGV